jgi:hypothetical protein
MKRLDDNGFPEGVDLQNENDDILVKKEMKKMVDVSVLVQDRAHSDVYVSKRRESENDETKKCTDRRTDPEIVAHVQSYEHHEQHCEQQLVEVATMSEFRHMYDLNDVPF